MQVREMSRIAQPQTQLARVQHRDIGASREVVLEQLVVICTIYHIRREQQAILLALTVEVVALSEQRVAETAV